MKYITFTNNISPDLMQWIEKYSTKEQITRRAILEKALTEFRKAVRKKEYIDSFRKASVDLNIKNMAEDGLGDYFRQLAYLEQ